MSKQLLETLEHRVHSAVDTIETLRTEINVLKEERKTLEDKLQELIERIGAADHGNSARATEEPMESAEESSPSSFGPSIQAYKNQTSEY